MKTKLHLLVAPLLSSPVVTQLHFLTTQDAVDRMYLSTVMGCGHLCVVVLLKTDVNAKDLRGQKWVRKALHAHGVTFFILGPHEMDSHLKKSTLFLDFHCREEKRIYVAEGSCFQLPPYELSKSGFKQFKALFYKEIDLLTSQIENAKKVGSYVTTFSVYTTLFGHYFHYFEWLLFGVVYSHEDLQVRLQRLCYYYPVFRKAFVKSSATTYFLLDILASVVDIEQDDVSRLDVDYLLSVAVPVDLFASFIESVFNRLQKKAKKQRMVIEFGKREAVHEDLLRLFVKHPKVEEIYVYHKRYVQGVNGEPKEIQYWLVVGDDISHHGLSNWYESAKQIMKGTVEVVPIAHRRIWIQKNLFENQLFFQKVMQKEFLLYSRELDFPAVHWQTPYSFCAPDLSFYRDHCLALFETIEVLRSADAGSVHEGLGLLYSQFIACSCQVIIYARLFYYPHHLPIGILWYLAELADDRVFQLRFLVGKLGFDLVKFVGCHQTVYRSVMNLKLADLALMDEIVDELRVLC